MDYSEMKATKTSKSESAKDAISSLASVLSQGKSTSKKSTSSSSKSSSTKKTNSASKKTTSKSSRGKSSSTTKKRTSSKSSKTKKPDNSFFETTVSTLKDVANITSNTKSKKKKTSSSSKKSKKALILAFSIFFLLIGALGGFFTAHIICKNDVYAMVCYDNGEADIVIGQDEEYQYYRELGVKCVAFGRDCSDEFKVTYYYRNDLSMDEVEVDGVDTSVEGIYYAVYTAPSKKYSTVKLIRNIIVLRGEDDAQ